MEGIRHSELRSGNLVIGYNKEVEIVQTIDLQTEPAGSWAVVGFVGKNYFNYPGDLTPIKITEEWLSKLGFSIKEDWKSGNGTSFYKEDRKVEVSISNGHGIQIHITGKSTPRYMIEYVHELQNIYKELTGEELVL